MSPTRKSRLHDQYRMCHWLTISGVGGRELAIIAAMLMCLSHLSHLLHHYLRHTRTPVGAVRAFILPRCGEPCFSLRTTVLTLGDGFWGILTKRQNTLTRGASSC
ncbi:hypothetical protein CC78DRAFT_10954 [Lojkania enalia]|uniref:Uncharacterized protein n=1 Tax=Lojkania enalia TaxID=147567 RepID=A0A9P4ND95_9PLEO|nr:hypothetical protein CC78DRAFT_10954 [Didymosphaeria enalia]